MADAEADQQVELVEFPYPFVEDDDQKLRCFIAEHFMNAEIDGAILVANMDAVYQWILKGTVSKARAKPQLVKP